MATSRMLTMLNVLAVVSFVMLLATGCSSILPSSKKNINSEWMSFEDAKAAFDQIKLNQTDSTGLDTLGFGPRTASNVRILNYLELIERFMPNPAVTFDDLDGGVRRCLKARAHCEGYQVIIRKIDKERVGNAMADLFNFRRRTHVTGWEFDALLVLNRGVVVYKVWGGTPNINESDSRKNPLGPLQRAPEAVVDQVL